MNTVNKGIEDLRKSVQEKEKICATIIDKLKLILSKTTQVERNRILNIITTIND